MNEAFKQLLGMLLKRTEAKALPWTEVYDGVFRTEVGSGLVRISESDVPEVDQHGNDFIAPAYHIAVLNQDGKVAEETTISYGENFRTAAALYSAARRSALGTEELLRDMLQALGGK